MGSIITGLFENSHNAALAVRHLGTIGLTDVEINIVANDSHTRDSFRIEENTKGFESDVANAKSSRLLAAVVDSMTLVAGGVISGVGYIVTGQLIATLAVEGASAETRDAADAIVGALVPQYEIKRYKNTIEKGSILIGVKHNDDNKSDIIKALENAGAQSN